MWVEGTYFLGGRKHPLAEVPPGELGRQCEGYFAGDAVVAYGKVVDGPRGRALEAQALTTETVEEIVGGNESLVRAMLVAGLVLGAVGLPLAALGAWRLVATRG